MMFDQMICIQYFSPVTKESQSQNDADTTKDSSKTNVSGKSSRTGRDTKAYVLPPITYHFCTEQNT